VLTKKGVGTHRKNYPLENSFKLVLKQNMKKVWEARSYAFPDVVLGTSAIVRAWSWFWGEGTENNLRNSIAAFQRFPKL